MHEGIEKRKFIRVRFPCKIVIYDIPEHTISTHTENISAGGVRVIIAEKIDLSGLVGIELHLKGNIIICKGKIAWVVDKKSPYRSGVLYHDTGVEFYEIKDHDRRLIHTIIEKMLCV